MACSGGNWEEETAGMLNSRDEYSGLPVDTDSDLREDEDEEGGFWF